MYFTVSIEVQIVLAICLFYGYDAALALQPHQGLLRAGARRWHGRLAMSGFELRRAWLLWPPIFLPHQPLYRLNWDATHIALAGDLSTTQRLAADAQRVKGFALPIYLLAAWLFVLLPAALLVLHSQQLQLIALGLIYLTTLWLSALAWRHGRHGHAKEARSIALQILLCPPFALNVVKKLSLADKHARPDLLLAAKQLLSTADWKVLAAQAHQAIARELQEIAGLPELAERHQALEKSLQLLTAELPQEIE
ncbi:hypothetical protein COAQ111491_13355 [Comamonas aquatilis]|uniref:hypothetical protein n=1 Tax=Comamonas aquatilis TaxID=1778406 RepID=UPI0039F0DA2B